MLAKTPSHVYLPQCGTKSARRTKTNNIIAFVGYSWYNKMLLAAMISRNKAAVLSDVDDVVCHKSDKLFRPLLHRVAQKPTSQ